MRRRHTSLLGFIAAALAVALVGLLVVLVAQLLAPRAGAQAILPEIPLPQLVEALPQRSVWLYEAPPDPVFPEPCDDPATFASLTTTGPAAVWYHCEHDPETGLRLVVTVQGPRCAVLWNETIIERRWCAALPMVRR